MSRKPPAPWGQPSPTPPGRPIAARGPECSHCGAAATPGLADCAFCGCAYAGVARGAKCPGCGKVNTSRRTACASCQHDLTRPCHCGARSPLELVACWHCHHAFPTGAGPHAGAVPGATIAQDPCAVFSTLDDILKS